MSAVTGGEMPRPERFPAISHEHALDRAIMIAQEQETAASRRRSIVVEAIRALRKFTLDRVPDCRAKHFAVEHLDKAYQRHARIRAELKPYLTAVRAVRPDPETFGSLEQEGDADEIARIELVAIQRHLASLKMKPFKRRHRFLRWLRARLGRRP